MKYKVNTLITTELKLVALITRQTPRNLIDDKTPNDTKPIALLTEWTNRLFTAIPNQMELDSLLQDGLITFSTTLY